MTINNNFKNFFKYIIKNILIEQISKFNMIQDLSEFS